MAQNSSHIAPEVPWLRARAGAWFTALFVFCFACAQITYSIVMIDPNDQKWLWVALLATLALAAIAWRLLQEREFRIDSLDALLAVFILYSGLSLAWSPDRVSGLLFLVKIAAATAIFVYLKDFGGELLFRRLIAWTTFATAVALWLAYTQPGAWGGFHNQNFITEYLLLALPFCFGYIAIASSRIRRALAALTVLGAFWYLLVDNPSRLEFNIIPLVAAGAFGLACGRQWGWRPVLAIGALVVLGFVIVTVAYWSTFPFGERGLRHSLLPRVGLALDTFSMWLSAPILGHGAGSFQYLFPAYQEDHLHRFGLDSVLFSVKHIVAGAAHNEYLQLLSSFGLVGAALAGAFVWRAVRIIRDGPAFGPVQYAALGAILVWAINAALEFPLQNPATMLLALASVAILVSNPYRSERDSVRLAAGPRTVSLVVVMAIAGAIGVQVLCDRLTDASKYFRIATHLMSIGDARGAYLGMREAYRHNPWDYQIRMATFLNAVILMDAESWSAPTWGERLRRQPFLSNQINALYDTALSAGRQAGLLHSRLYYLVRSGNYPQHRDEIAGSLAFLRKNASRIHDTWKMDALFGLLYGDLRQMAAAREAAEENGMPKDQLDQIRGLEKSARAGAGKMLQQQEIPRFELHLPAAPTAIIRRLDPAN